MSVSDIKALKDLVINSEGSRMEFKESTGQLDRGMETLCAFLNGNGGTVLFGVTDKGQIIGQEISDKTKRDIAEAIRRIEPSAPVEVTYIEIPETNKSVISIVADGQNRMRPFSYKGRAYQRTESVTSSLPQDKYHLLLMQRGGDYSWEAQMNPDLQISDLNETTIMNAVRGGVRSGRLPEDTTNETVPTILGKFDLLRNGKLNNAAAVLFGKDFYGYPQCLLRLARFKGVTKEEFWDNQQVRGNIYELLNAAMSFFFKHLSLSGKTDGLYREEELRVPYKALRECCINAFAHRSYHERGSSTSIAIYDDRIEITNTGAFPPDIQMERLLDVHDSHPQNPIIANVLYKSEVLENWGRGIGLMVDECRRVDIPDPEFHADGGFVWVVFRFAKVQIWQDNVSITQDIITTHSVSKDAPSSTIQAPQSTPQAPHKHPISTTQDPPSTPIVPHKYPTSTPQDDPTSTIQVQRLLEAIGDDTYSIKELLERMNLRDRKSFIKTYINPAIKSGLVEPLYPDQPTHPNQKYRRKL